MTSKCAEHLQRWGRQAEPLLLPMPSAAGRRRRAVGSRAVSRSSWLCRVRSSSRARSTAWRDRASTSLSDSSARPTALCMAAQRGVMVEIGTAVLGKFQTGQKRPGSSPAITPRQFDETSPLRLGYRVCPRLACRVFLVLPSPAEIRKSCHEILAKEQSGHAILSAPAVVFDLNYSSNVERKKPSRHSRSAG